MNGLWDHPRSRGVYGQCDRGVALSVGSSPLARGLQCGLPVDGQLQGIIPARAGFTPRTINRDAESGDHPRSRGVYGNIRGYATSRGGSSPLARGLPVRNYLAHPTARIIPARAGFTGIGLRRSLSRTDHPRSRGVYDATIKFKQTLAGSSPLARGLHGGGRNNNNVIGIIPARAGFTGRIQTYL